MSSRGTYVLVVDLPRATTLEVGALGEREFDPGTYAYVGSAFGPGGFARVDRHRELARGERDTRHWHIDYVLGHPETTLEPPSRSPTPIGSANWRRRCPGSRWTASELRTATARGTCSPRRTGRRFAPRPSPKVVAPIRGEWPIVDRDGEPSPRIMPAPVEWYL